MKNACFKSWSKWPNACDNMWRLNFSYNTQISAVWMPGIQISGHSHTHGWEYHLWGTLISAEQIQMHLCYALIPYPYSTHPFHHDECQWFACELCWSIWQICEWGGWSMDFSHMTIVKYLISANDTLTLHWNEFFLAGPPSSQMYDLWTNISMHLI